MSTMLIVDVVVSMIVDVVRVIMPVIIMRVTVMGVGVVMLMNATVGRRG